MANVHAGTGPVGAACWVTVTVFPATLITPTREAPVLKVATMVRVELPVPLEVPAISTHGAPLDTDHWQPDWVSSVNESDPPAAGTVPADGVRLYVHAEGGVGGESAR
jgi:hypothetical protein